MNETKVKSPRTDLVLTEAQIEEMKLAAMPLMAWMEKNFHPHIKEIVNSGKVELLEGVAQAFRYNRQSQERIPA